MKKITLIPAFFILLALISFKDYSICNGANSSHKAIACNACHGGNIAGGVVVIGGGKDDVETNDDNSSTDFEVEVKLPNVDLESIQIASYIIDQKLNTPVIAINKTEIALNTRTITLFNALNLASLGSGKTGEDKSFTINYHFNEALTEAQTVVIQGVISNNDGTVNGDQTFYKEVVLQAKSNIQEETSEAPISSSIVQEKHYYNNNQLYIRVSNPQKVRVLDLQGKIVLDTKTNENKAIDVSNLSHGNYFVVIGTSGKEMQNFQFAK